jgi:hypothetical protein
MQPLGDINEPGNDSDADDDDGEEGDT